jgi:hypothetical protein
VTPVDAAFAPADDCAAGRAAFVEQARAVHAQLSHHPIAARGRSGETLTIDCAYLGAPQPDTLAVITGGVHGVEAPAGGALQRLWLGAFADALPAHCGALFVHALNPFGYAHGRRVNENNVDLNRNALAAFPGPENAAYHAIDRWLNPRTPCPNRDDFWPGALLLALRHGRAKLQQAIAGGQYEFPTGLFYGGARTQESLTTFSLLLRRPEFAAVRDVLHLDLHTGLGTYGEYNVLVDFARHDPRYARLEQYFGAQRVASDHRDGATFYAAHGLLPEITARAFPQATLTAAVIEFGTYSATRVLKILRLENRAEHVGCRTAQRAAEIRRLMRETFSPADPRWRAQVIAHGRRLAPQILAYLHRTPK